MNNGKKQLLTVLSVSVLSSCMVLPSAWAGPLMDLKTCKATTAMCRAEAKTIRKVNRLTSGRTCRAPKKNEPQFSRTYTVIHYGPYGPSKPDISLEMLTSRSGGECLVSANSKTVICGFFCTASTANPALYELTGQGTVEILLKGGKIITPTN
jgi:hypothetical protein